MKFGRIVLYIEAIFINLGSGLLAFLAPAFFLTALTGQTVAPVPLEIIRWYGVLLFVFSYVMLRALRSNNVQAVAFLVEGFLMGDLVHLVACVLFINAGARVNLAVGFMIFSAAFLASVRTRFLILHYRSGAISRPARSETRDRLRPGV